MKFSSPGMLTAEREPMENMTISLGDLFLALRANRGPFSTAQPEMP